MLSFRQRIFNCILSCIPNTTEEKSQLLEKKTFPSQLSIIIHSPKLGAALILKRFSGLWEMNLWETEETTLQKYILGESPQWWMWDTREKAHPRKQVGDCKQSQSNSTNRHRLASSPNKRMSAAVPIVLGPVSIKPEADQSARGPVATPVTPKSSPSEKLAQRVSDAKKSFESTPSPARKNLRLDQQIQALVHGAEETLNTSRYVLVWNKRNQRCGVQALKNRHQEATNEYEALYAAHQNLLSQHTKLLADLTSIMKEFAAVEDLQRKKLDAIRAMTEAESVEHLLQTVCALEIDVAKTTEVPQAIPILSTPVKVHPDTR